MFSGSDSVSIWSSKEYCLVIWNCGRSCTCLFFGKISFKEKHCDSIKGEFKSNGVNNELKHTEGVLSMARTMIKDSASSQFFIMHKPAPHLDGEYAAFGKITEGLDIVDQIANVPTNFQDCPTTPVVIKTIRRA